MRRRDLVGGLAVPVAMLLPRLTSWRLIATNDADAADNTPPPPADGPFAAPMVAVFARQLAGQAYRAPDKTLPPWLANLSYDEYRSIRFQPAQALWRGDKLPFQAEFFHRGFYFTDRVDVFEVANGQAKRIAYSPDLFDLGQAGAHRPAASADDLGFAGFRIHAPINRADYYDEVCVFLGASYFRAVGRDQVYGLSARGLAIKTADPGGEEFPVFKCFWLERPDAAATSIVVHALLDSPSAAAAFRFVIHPGQETVFDVEMTLYPRVDIDQAGIATLTSMYDFGANDRLGVDDFRPAVHDSDGLLMWSRPGEQIWRPLSNPGTLQLAEFSDPSPRGFGLMQRTRDFFAYEDLEAHYERRPSLWIEPIGEPGDGAVHLVEIPTRREIDDNIVVFWRPRQKLQAHGEYRFTYRQHWCGDLPWSTDLARVVSTRTGAGHDKDTRLFVLEFAGGKLAARGPEVALHLDASADQGKIANAVIQPNPETRGWRISFELHPADGKVVELRVQLMDDTGPVSETWIRRWII